MLKGAIRPTLFKSLNEFDFITGDEGHLGRGSYASVRLARCKRDGRRYAIKTITMTSLYENNVSQDIIEQEIKIHMMFNHPNIIRLYDFIKVSLIGKGLNSHDTRVRYSGKPLSFYEKKSKVVTNVQSLDFCSDSGGYSIYTLE